jgi:hypothetical protein
MLKTKCKECVFNENDNCTLGKPTTNDPDGMNTEGYCRHKRTIDWRNKVDPLLLDSKEFLVRKVNEEEARLSVIIICLDNDVDKLNDTLTSLTHCKDFVRQLIVVTDKAHGQGFIDILEAITAFGVPWNLENLKGDYEYAFNDVHDYVSPLVKCHWLVAIPAGYMFETAALGDVQTLLSYDNNNYVAFYHKDYFVCNIFAFHELNCNYGTPWMDKVKYFTNWEQVCRKLD